MIIVKCKKTNIEVLKEPDRIKIDTLRQSFIWVFRDTMLLAEDLLLL